MDSRRLRRLRLQYVGSMRATTGRVFGRQLEARVVATVCGGGGGLRSRRAVVRRHAIWYGLVAVRTFGVGVARAEPSFKRTARLDSSVHPRSPD